MFKICLIYAIFEKCLNTIFSGFIDAFNKPNCVKSYEELKGMEDSIILYNIPPRSNKRRVWQIDTGMMPKRRAVKYMNRYAEVNLQANIKKYYRTVNYNSRTGETTLHD